MLTFKYLIKNKKRTLITISGITLVTILFLCIGLFFSSIREYMIKDIIKNNGNYHVSLKVDNIDKSHIKNIETKENTKYIIYDDISKTYKYTKEKCKNKKCKDITYNENLLSLYGVSPKENMIEMFKKLIIIILTILSLGIVVIIYNSFSISVTQRKKQFSLLKSVGMTQKKIKNMVLLEGIITLICGLFIGFIISVNLMFIILRTISNLLSELFTSTLTLSFYPSFVLIPLIFIVIIVLISAYLPAKKASKQNIIDSLRNNEEFKYKKEPKFIEKLSITKRLAYYNYKRCKKKYRPIILCIFIGVIIYTTFSLYLNYGMKSINDFSGLPKYDYEVNIINSDKKKKDSLENYAKENSDDYNIFNICTIKAKINEEDYLDTKYKNNNLIIISGQENYVINRIKQTDIKANKMIKIDKPYLKNKVHININNSKQEFKTKNKIPLGIEKYLTKDNIVLVTKDINSYCQDYNTMLILKGNINLDKSLKKFSKENDIQNIEYVDIKKANQLTKNIIMTIKIVLYAVTILVLLIGISSIVNTIWTSINLRSKEFACLKSIGLTKKQMREMLMIESIYIVLKGFALSLPFVYIVNYLLYESLKKVFEMEMLIPYKEITIIFITLLLIVYLTMLITHKKFNNNKIITMLTNDNI